MLSTIMRDEKGGMSSRRINYYSNPNLIDPKLKTRTRKHEMPSNYLYFTKNIDKISALGNESCKCWHRLGYFGMNLFDMTIHDRTMMAFLDKKSCHNTGNNRKSFLGLLDSLRNKILTEHLTKHENAHFKAFMTKLILGMNKKHKYHHLIPLSMQNLYTNYRNDAKKLYKEYLKNAHAQIHVQLPPLNYTHKHNTNNAKPV